MLWCHAPVHRGDNFSLDFPPHCIFTCFWNLPLNQSTFPLTLWLLMESLLLICYTQQILEIPTRLLGHVWMDLRRCTPKSSCRRGQTDWSTSRPWCEGGCKGVQQFIYWHKFGMSSPRLTILCYFDSCHLKENKTAAVIRVRRELSPFLLNNSRVLADLLQPPMPASLMLLRSLPLLLPTCCGQIQLPALFPFQH